MVQWLPSQAKLTKLLELRAIQLSSMVDIRGCAQLGKPLASNKSFLLAVIISTIQENLMGL